MGHGNFGGRFFEWTPDDSPASVLPLQESRDWETLRNRYDPYDVARPLKRVLELARGRGTSHVLVEHRYIDADFRSEHSRFYSTTFRRYPSVCHRLHFFTEEVRKDLSNLDTLQDSYLGYSIMRPTPRTPVGRTVLSPPTELSDGTAVVVDDEIDLFGNPLTARGMPFVSQDAQYLVCAHAAEWMVLYHAHLHHNLPRRLPGEIHDSAFGGEIAGRQVPSQGLSVSQLLGSLHGFGISASKIELPNLREKSRAQPALSLPALICRYVNSQLPPIVLSDDHAWVIVGYTREEHRSKSTHDQIILWRHDDARGPYMRVDDPWNENEDAHKPWGVMLPPLPQKSYLTAEVAESLGRGWLSSKARATPKSPIGERQGRGALTFRTYCVRSRTLKREVGTRLPSDVAQLYRMTHMPRYVWVVEAMDRDLRDEGSDAVLGEVLLDSTAHQHSDSLLNDSTALIAGHVLGDVAASTTPDHESVRRVDSTSRAPYRSGCAAASV